VGGIKALKPKPIGGRQRQNMTLPEEKALLAKFARLTVENPANNRDCSSSV
jgi:hypothetical protein